MPPDSDTLVMQTSTSYFHSVFQLYLFKYSDNLPQQNSILDK